MPDKTRRRVKRATPGRSQAVERPFHLQTARFLRLALPPPAFFFHVPNQGRRSVVTGALFKAMGLLPGLTDLVIIAPYAVVPTPAPLNVPTVSLGFLELKRPDGEGELSEDQEEFRDRCRAASIPWAEAKSLDEVAQFAASVVARVGLGLRAVVR